MDTHYLTSDHALLFRPHHASCPQKLACSLIMWSWYLCVIKVKNEWVVEMEGTRCHLPDSLFTVLTSSWSTADYLPTVHGLLVKVRKRTSSLFTYRAWRLRCRTGTSSSLGTCGDHEPCTCVRSGPLSCRWRGTFSTCSWPGCTAREASTSTGES